MKKIFLITTAILLFFLIQTGCKKDIEDAIDCSSESFFLSVQAQVDTTNPRLVHFTFVNDDSGGTYSLDNQIIWNFGDGKNGTSQGLTISHAYAASGTFTATGTYILRKGTSSCSSYKEKSVTVN